ncbi:MAG: hypothetical protein IIB58_01265 [Planctomycetes bacterium]|nr:hypothetical protein [Planctomycetota bacterium]
MAAFDDAFHVLEDSAWKRLLRDIRLIYWLIKMFIAYIVVGGPVRRDYGRRKRSGEPYYID